MNRSVPLKLPKPINLFLNWCISSIAKFMMETTEITLNYNREDLEELYFKNGENKSFCPPKFKLELYIVISLFAFLVVAFIYYLITGELSFLGIMIFVLFLTSMDLYRKASPTILWKREIRDYLDGLDKIKKNKIVLTAGSFSLIQDDKETIERWTEFKKAEINGTHILLLSGTNYIIPKKSMTPSEFDLLKKVVSEKIKAE